MDAREKPESANKDLFERWLDAYFELPFFMLRYVTLIPVLVSFVGAVLMFIIGAVESWEAVCEALYGSHAAVDHAKEIQIKLIRSVDFFLLGLVLMIFSYGIYDLFVSKLDPADKKGIRPDWLKFRDIGDLKIRLAEVVLVILMITFFELVLDKQDKFTDVWMLLVIPIGVLLIGVGIAFFEKMTHR